MIDTHTHITDPSFSDEDRKRILDEMPENGLQAICEIGADRASSDRAFALAHSHPRVFCAVGTHPHEVSAMTQDDLDTYRRYAADPRVVAIGEIGLDYHYDLSPRDMQRQAMARQLELAHQVGLPVVLHMREAIADALAILNECRPYLQHGLLMHCYTGSVESLREFNRLDCYYALGGVVTFRNAKKEDVIRAIPEDRLLLETDCPYMTPVPLRGQRNEPAYVMYAADKIAAERGITREELDTITTRNALRLFSRMSLVSEEA